MTKAEDPGRRPLAERDATAAERDRRALERDRRAAHRDTLADGEQETDRRAAAVDRQAAAVDRRAAAADRRAAAADRQAAAADRERADTDELTGAMRRGSGLDALRRAIARAHRSAEPLAVAFIDVDGLKHVNDAQGHAAGDRLLRTVVGSVEANLRSYDLVIRYGGDEFVCVLEGMSVQHAGRRIAAINEALRAELGGAAITAGLVGLESGEGADDVLARADRALYARRAERRFVATPASEPGAGAERTVRFSG